ncbi:DUF4267 domain-containing protein [Pyxidicoccus fallax]|uniref:DUF4267 domain-containing protein n=1 Tax=Pyxidicoccus fallax TaxID=394095 RepID=A0A848LS46_9BACT|nr:DUF4267 domain-containing protein [Pyxidicoccus fallax]NMO20511.1 DUF4267 domain-containing protein [Pyxidicoccus fallax]NPC85513.1 DUF4267 domain-containing protein [Pyxidicoccus fallax]
MQTHRNDLSWKLTSPTALLTLLLGGFMLFLSINTRMDPVGAARGFGLPLLGSEALPWLSIKSGRDLGIGLAIVGLVLTRQRLAAGVFVLAAIVMPIVDALTVLKGGASLALALSVHGSAAVYCVILAAALLRRVRND